MPFTESSPRVVYLRGDHDVSTVTALSKCLVRAISRGDADLVVDLSRVTFLDAASVGVMMRVRTMLGEQSRSLGFRSPSRVARRVLELSGLGRLIEDAGDASALRTWVAVPAMASSLVPDREGP